MLPCTSAYVDVANSLGLTVNTAVHKFLVTGCDVMKEVRMAATILSIEYISDFPYFGSLIVDSGRLEVL